MPRALIFDCDGVLADTERDGHLVAFNLLFAEIGLPIRWSEEQYADLVRIGGGKERLRAFLTDERARSLGLPTETHVLTELIGRWHRRKSELFRALVRDGAVPARPGVRRLVDEALSTGWRVAVASTSAESSVLAVLQQAVGPDNVQRVAVFAGDIVAHKKPAPDIYLRALQDLPASPDTCVVVEDSAVGLQAATAAGLLTVVTPSSYTRDDDFSAAAAVVSDLGEPTRPAQIVRDPHGVARAGLVDVEGLSRLIERRS